ncbi:MAG: hypothetical protein NZ765_01225 [Anaerolineae bacterium]|nr:hypothetical protein [Anaerolineae bacterium]MDW8070180.1 hypothetical protein [Anaerolineae bacterium]
MPENVFPLAWYTSLGAVALLSLLLTGYELFKIFQPEFVRTLWNWHAFFLFALNVLAALFTWGCVHILLGIRPTLLSTLATGLIFPTLLRSRFTLYRTLAPPAGEGKSVIDELSLKMDEIYHSLQSALYKAIDRKLARERVVLNKQVRDTSRKHRSANGWRTSSATSPSTPTASGCRRS